MGKLVTGIIILFTITVAVDAQDTALNRARAGSQQMKAAAVAAPADPRTARPKAALPAQWDSAPYLTDLKRQKTQKSYDRVQTAIDRNRTTFKLQQDLGDNGDIAAKARADQLKIHLANQAAALAKTKTELNALETKYKLQQLKAQTKP